MNLQRTVFSRLYRRSPNVESLPWHREQPPALLERAVAQRSTRGRALDVGCGEGVYSAYLAKQGFSVVGVDFVPAALAAARTLADLAELHLDLHEADVLDYSSITAFDVVLDSGCLHHLPKGKVSRYRARLDEWLAPGGDYVLVHFAHSRPWGAHPVMSHPPGMVTWSSRGARRAGRRWCPSLRGTPSPRAA